MGSNICEPRPIILTKIWSGALFGDDSKTETAPGGYRDGVTSSPLDEQDPDPLVDLAEANVPHHKVYAIGATPGLCPYYGNGLGAPQRLLVRAPVAKAIGKMNRLVDTYFPGREYVVVDGFREDWVQARLYASVFNRNLTDAGLVGVDLTVAQFLDIAFATDNIASYNRMDTKSVTWARAMEELKSGTRWNDVIAYAQAKGEDPDYIAAEMITFEGNLSVARGEKQFTLDRNGFTAHGGGGACDIYPRWIETGEWLNLGVPFDSTSPASRIDWFETHTRGEYEALVNEDSSLKQYLCELGVTEITDDLFRRIQMERRYLFEVLVEVGGTPYVGEPWHCNFGHKFGGKHVGALPELAGNSCQSWIHEVRNQQGNLVAIWTNPVAHRLAEAFYDKAA